MVTVRNAMVALEQYPQLMLLHLVRNFRTYGGLKGVRLETEDDVTRFRERAKGSIILTTMLAVAWQTAGPAIEVGSPYRIMRR